MKRYIKAQGDIHVPGELKEKVISGIKKRPSKPVRWAVPVAAVLALAIIAGLMLNPQSTMSGSVQAMYEPQLPQMSQYPKEADYFDSSGEFDSEAYSKAYDAWREGRSAQTQAAQNYGGGLWDLAQLLSPQVLDGSENSVYSPLSVYMALAMLAETTGGTTREELLSLLGAATIEEVRESASAIWNASYCDDGVYTSILSSSLWLRDNTGYDQDTLERLSRIYYASSYSGQLGSQEMDKALQSWLDQNTGGLLKDQTQTVNLSPQTVLALCTTVYLQGRWSDEFYKEDTQEDTFHSPQGNMRAQFMRQTFESGTYYRGDDFGAVRKGIQNGGSMWLILPDEGATPQQLLEGSQLTQFLSAGYNWPQAQVLKINLSMPKFDVTCETDLLDILGAMEVTTPGLADFSPLLGTAASDNQPYLSQATHAARVKVDEEGLEAAAFTVLSVNDAAQMPQDQEIDFTLDRPFIFAITGLDGLPLFVGVINQI